HTFSGAALCAGFPVLVLSGCGGGDDSRFAAVTEDETASSQSLEVAPPEADAGPGPAIDGGTPTDGGSGGVAPSGFWHFDDCSPASTVLVDSSGNGAHAQHAKGRTCAPGIDGQAVSFRGKK